MARCIYVFILFQKFSQYYDVVFDFGQKRKSSTFVKKVDFFVHNHLQNFDVLPGLTSKILGRMKTFRTPGIQQEFAVVV